jgi:hypothetical protein
MSVSVRHDVFDCCAARVAEPSRMSSLLVLNVCHVANPGRILSLGYTFPHHLGLEADEKDVVACLLRREPSARLGPTDFDQHPYVTCGTLKYLFFHFNFCFRISKSD